MACNSLATTVIFTRTHTRTMVLPSSSSSGGTHVVCAICIMSKVLKCCRMCLSFDFKGTMRLKACAPRPKLTQLFSASHHPSLKLVLPAFLKSSFPLSSLLLSSFRPGASVARGEVFVLFTDRRLSIRFQFSFGLKAITFSGCLALRPPFKIPKSCRKKQIQPERADSKVK